MSEKIRCPYCGKEMKPCGPHFTGIHYYSCVCGANSPETGDHESATEAAKNSKLKAESDKLKSELETLKIKVRETEELLKQEEITNSVVCDEREMHYQKSKRLQKENEKLNSENKELAKSYEKKRVLNEKRKFRILELEIELNKEQEANERLRCERNRISVYFSSADIEAFNRWSKTTKQDDFSFARLKEENERLRYSFEQGYVLAVANIMRLHKDSVVACDVMSELGEVDWSTIADEDILALEAVAGNYSANRITGIVQLFKRLKECKKEAFQSADNAPCATGQDKGEV